MKNTALRLGFLAFAFLGCGDLDDQTAPADDSVKVVQKAFTTGKGPSCPACPSSPSNAPEGYVCTLVEQSCDANHSSCGYSCKKKEAVHEGGHTLR